MKFDFIYMAGMVVVSFALSASTVRGRLQHATPQGILAAPGVGVTVYALDSPLGRSPIVYTDPNGMYYVNNVPPGRYVLEIWVTNPPWTFQIFVQNIQFTDIAPINL